MNAKIVVDTGFGDAGKGVTVDNLCNSKSLVVRFSGGQQAGHTVIRNGVKHVFSNFGAGTLQGCPTYFTEDTTMYLSTIWKERELLENKGFSPILYIHPLCNVTTPYDVAFNRITEKINKHGSCGLGVAATMKRNIETPYKLYAVDFFNKKIFEEKVYGLKEFYKNKILDIVLGINNIKLDAFLKVLEDQFFDYLDRPLPFAVLPFEALINLPYDNIVFEGSQGIMLDMDHGFFPNVTYANTTSKNAMKYCKEYGLSPEIFYVSRCYQTRHGVGYMTDERNIELINNEEEINVLNEYQGNFRLGEMDYDLINHAIRLDGIYTKNRYESNLVITCVDQRPDFKIDYSRFYSNNIYLNSSPKCDNMIQLVDENYSEFSAKLA